MRTKWPLISLLFVIPGAALTYWYPDLISGAAPVEQPAVHAAGLSTPAAAAAAPQDGWQARPGPRYDAEKVAAANLNAPQVAAVDEPVAETQASTPAASAQARADCRKYLRTLHLPKAAPKAKAVGLLDQPDKAARVPDPNKVVAILNQRILRADECLKRAGPGS